MFMWHNCSTGNLHIEVLYLTHTHTHTHSLSLSLSLYIYIYIYINHLEQLYMLLYWLKPIGVLGRRSVQTLHSDASSIIASGSSNLTADKRRQKRHIRRVFPLHSLIYGTRCGRQPPGHATIAPARKMHSDVYHCEPPYVTRLRQRASTPSTTTHNDLVAQRRTVERCSTEEHVIKRTSVT